MVARHKGRPMLNTQIAREGVVYFADARQALPGEIVAATLNKWTRRGIKGPDGIWHRLEWCRIGGRPATSIQAYYRFLDRTNGMLPPLPDDVARYLEMKKRMARISKLGGIAKNKR
jgi:hypothetical protein